MTRRTQHGESREPASQTASARVETKLIDTLFDQFDSIIVGQLAIVALAIMAYCHGRNPWHLGWAFALVFILPFRLALARAYWRRAPSDSPTLWAYRFSVGAGLTSLSYGAASAASVFHGDPFLQMIIITAQGAYVTVSAVRNNAVPRVAALQGAIPLLCLAGACFATRRLSYETYAILVLFHLVCVVQIIYFLSQKTRDLLVAEDRANAANALLEELATTDPLTGAANRRGFDTAMSKAVTHAALKQEDLSLLLLDLDHFKALNDAYGHQRGDECLRAVACCLRDTGRPSDLVSRHGGEEFAILLPATGYAGAAAAAERVRMAIVALSVAHPTSPLGVMTVSVGYATMGHGGVADVGALVRGADGALYRAKDLGRNRIAGHTDEAPIRAAMTAYDLVTI